MNSVIVLMDRFRQSCNNTHAVFGAVCFAFALKCVILYPSLTLVTSRILSRHSSKISANNTDKSPVVFMLITRTNECGDVLNSGEESPRFLKHYLHSASTCSKDIVCDYLSHSAVFGAPLSFELLFVQSQDETRARILCP